ncbi:MAG: hypothetical protein V3T01_01295 [Myxococcota bacterium]
MNALLDAIAFSSLWVAAAAGALCTAASLAMGTTPEPSVVAIAVTGTLFVYNVDRLRDLERDRATTPRRSDFVARHGRILMVMTGMAGLLSLIFATALRPLGIALLGPVLAVGLFHRRLKRFPSAKSIYVTAAWLVVVVGLPASAGQAPTDVGWTAVVLGLPLFATAIAANIRDAETTVTRFGHRESLATARGLAGLGTLVALVATPSIRPLFAVPLATLASLAAFRGGERYGLIVVDGALILGAALAIGVLAL